VNFLKMHGTGNDFVVINASGEERDWSSLAVAMCDRHFGVGSDGLILALPSSNADLRMRMFNPDGSEAEMCGNGIRCLTKFAIENGIANPKAGAITIETLAGDLRCETSIRDGRVDRVRVAMGAPRFRPEQISVKADGDGPLRNFPVSVDGSSYPVTCVSMGNPHAVLFTDTPVERFDLEHIGPRIEHHPAFPKRVNFEVVNVLERGHVRARVWERGAGLTLACGTGACAVGVAAYLADISDGRTIVSLPGGDLEIEWDGSGDVFLSGPAVEVFRGEWVAGRPEPATAATTGAA
jgi:diaminopimelate epimerase